MRISPSRSIPAALAVLAVTCLLGPLPALAATAVADSGGICGSLANGYGPYDYRRDRGPTLEVVEKRHFTTEIKMLRTYRAESPGSNIAYTLHAFPNHHEALLATVKLAEKEKADPPRDMRYTVDCYFERALRFRADDHTARLLYAQYLTSKNRQDDARKHIEEVSRTAKDNAFTQYNIGLLYLDMKDYDKALQQAHLAMSLGFPRMGLKDSLSAAGKWREPAAAAASAPAASAP